MGRVQDTITGFLQAENERDWESYGRYLDPRVEWTIYGPPQRRVVRGRDAYVDAMKAAYAANASTFEIEAFAVDEEEGLALVEFNLDGRRSVCVFELRDGQIIREREYFDDTSWKQHGRVAPG